MNCKCGHPQPAHAKPSPDDFSRCLAWINIKNCSYPCPCEEFENAHE